MIMAAQDQGLRANSIKRVIDKQNVSAKCRMCGEGDQTSHIVQECKKTCSKTKSMLEARQRGAGDSLRPNYLESLVMTGRKNITIMEPQPRYESTGCPRRSFLSFISMYFSMIGLGKQII